MTPPLTPSLEVEALFHQWFQQRILRDHRRNLPVTQAWADWQRWAIGQVEPTNRRWFTAQMRAVKMAAHTFRDNGLSVYLGYRLQEANND